MALNGAIYRESMENGTLSFSDWTSNGLWENIFSHFIEGQDVEYIMIDSTIIPAHACSTLKKSQQQKSLGRSAGGFSTKIHVVYDALGYH